MSSSSKNPHHDVILQTGGLTAAIVLAEPTIFLSGFSKNEQQESTPALVRGSLILRVTKPKKLKSITLDFSGISRTEWPEGIPSEKNETYESKEVFSHQWRLFSVQQKSAASSSGAHSVISLDSEHKIGESASNGTNSNNPLEPSTSTSHTLVNQQEAVSKGYRVFNPAEYIYNFELMLPHTLPETIRCNFGNVRWGFNLEIDRQGKFKPKLNAFKEVTLLRALGPSNLESSEPIVISRDWEDLLHYEIIIAGKAFAIGQTFNVGIGLVRMSKVKCHRIRIYITEHTEYFCRNNRIHRVEPSHKFLLLEHKSPEGHRGDLLSQQGSDISGLTEFEFNVKIPEHFPSRRDYLHPNANTECIKVYHWIKAVMRLSRQDSSSPNDSKCYEVSIDSPITLVDAQTLLKNELPQYNSVQRKKSVVDELKPYQKFIQEGSIPAGSTIPPTQRAILFARKPSVAPPPFDADDAPPPSSPPGYNESLDMIHSYRTRYMNYLHSKNIATENDQNGPPSPHSVPAPLSTSRTVDSPDEPTNAGAENDYFRQQADNSGDSESASQNSDQGSHHTAGTPVDEVAPSKDEIKPRNRDQFAVFSELYWSEDQNDTNRNTASPPPERFSDTSEFADLPSPHDSVPHPTSRLTAQLSSANASPRADRDNNDSGSEPTSPSFVPVSPGGGVKDQFNLPGPLKPASGQQSTGSSGSGSGSGSEGRINDSPVLRSGSFSQRKPSQSQRLRANPNSAGAIASSVGSAVGMTPSSVSARYPQNAPARRLSTKNSALSPRSPTMGWSDNASQLFGERWMDRRDSVGSVSSSAPRYFRQSSVVSMDLTRQAEMGRDSRRPSRVSEVQELRQWYPLSRNNSESSVAVSIAEFQAPDRQGSPLLRNESESEVDIGLEWDNDLEDYSGFENDRGSVTSTFYTIMTP